MSLTWPPPFCGSAWSSVMVRRLWSDHGTACINYAACSERRNVGKEIPSGFNSEVFEKEAAAIGSCVSLQALARRRGIAPTSHIALIRRQLSFRIAPACAGQNARAGNWARQRKIDVSNLFGMAALPVKAEYTSGSSLWNSSQAKTSF